MPSKTSVASIVAITAAIALSAGAWFYHQQLIELKTNNAELQQTRAALDQSTQRAREQTQALNDAVKNSEQHQQNQNAQSLHAARLVNGFNAASSVKTAIAESYMTNGKWPTSNKEAGIPEPDDFKAPGLSAITVQPNGKILLSFTNGGNPERIWLNGSVNAAMQVSFKCTTQDIPDIVKLIPTCSYSGK